ncbi:hypothetical protein ACFQH6_04855 [Halobacteriaceae archaeon GCM10025711]
MRWRSTFLAAGVATAVIGLAVVVRPQLAASVGVARVFVAFIGAFAALQAVLDLVGRRRATFRQAETGDPEEGLERLPAPGDSVDEALRRASDGLGKSSHVHRMAVEERLHGVAVEVVAHREHCSPEAAADLLASGEWTDDPVAAAFFADEDADLGDVSLRSLVRELVGSEHRFTRQARRAIAELDRMEEP